MAGSPSGQAGAPVQLLLFLECADQYSQWIVGILLPPLPAFYRESRIRKDMWAFTFEISYAAWSPAYRSPSAASSGLPRRKVKSCRSAWPWLSPLKAHLPQLSYATWQTPSVECRQRWRAAGEWAFGGQIGRPAPLMPDWPDRQIFTQFKREIGWCWWMKWHCVHPPPIWVSTGNVRADGGNSSKSVAYFYRFSSTLEPWSSCSHISNNFFVGGPFPSHTNISLSLPTVGCRRGSYQKAAQYHSTIHIGSFGVVRWEGVFLSEERGKIQSVPGLVYWRNVCRSWLFLVFSRSAAVAYPELYLWFFMEKQESLIVFFVLIEGRPIGCFFLWKFT